MPRSRNPEAYPSFFPKLLEHFTSGSASTFTFNFSTATQALDIKNTWYSYRRSLEHHAAKLKKEGQAESAASVRTRHRLALQWSCRLVPPLPHSSSPNYRDCLSSPCQLLFMNVSTDPRFLDLEAQLQAQAPSPLPSSDDDSPTLPSMSTFLEKFTQSN